MNESHQTPPPPPSMEETLLKEGSLEQLIFNVLKARRERSQQHAGPPTGGTTSWISMTLMAEHGTTPSGSTIRRACRLLEARRLIRNVSHDRSMLLWVYDSPKDKAERARQADREQAARGLSAKLAAHLGLPVDFVSVNPYRETILNVSMDLAEKMLNWKV